MFDLLVATAEAEGIPYTIEVSAGTTNTDMDAMYLSRAGVATGLVSIPLRYMHTPTEIVDLADVGSRYYTFVWTAVLVARACSAAGVETLVLDRPAHDD